ncbi:uncharacterized protein L969DRAFT_95420 [Mixia osmundae IAM 14324]|uniref:Sm domain-containing protein n=1 Tax=Mixia osmundae (strain CBS 9802 / IAM 14324 / JCM 22182 / KY 12970) TaxID=764103 RepID=G7E0G2_MIXOS|nr:uncharacterized protein L969DRAFT_95420 [Mixia osmundae IAM 14324]KEI38331.1 hypothetical protein L969DRAFT_95420 [Mixia osmundae IAM 14324]GAA96322.1 hypothetical protein E5Q_02988 [Mixia osmundae IAM 14324]
MKLVNEPYVYPEPAKTKAIYQVQHGLMGQKLEVTLSDGRRINGVFAALNQTSDIILVDATETVQEGDSVRTRSVGTVMLPGQHLVRATSRSQMHLDIA